MNEDTVTIGSGYFAMVDLRSGDLEDLMDKMVAHEMAESCQHWDTRKDRKAMARVGMLYTVLGTDEHNFFKAVLKENQ
jgi:hypothetical protein